MDPTSTKTWLMGTEAFERRMPHHEGMEALWETKWKFPVSNAPAGKASSFSAFDPPSSSKTPSSFISNVPVLDPAGVGKESEESRDGSVASYERVVKMSTPPSVAPPPPPPPPPSPLPQLEAYTSRLDNGVQGPSDDEQLEGKSGFLDIAVGGLVTLSELVQADMVLALPLLVAFWY